LFAIDAHDYAGMSKALEGVGRRVDLRQA